MSLIANNAALMCEKWVKISAEKLTDFPIPSPCISVCEIDPASKLCTGCLRTINEIAGWGNLPNEARRAIWTHIDSRAQSFLAQAL